MVQVRVQPQREQPRLRCPRCGSSDTKFRYFNNYSNNQPRYLCRRCNRQWTVGGTLRPIPFGGTNRPGKNAKPSTSRSELPQPPFPIRQEYLQYSHLLRPSRILVPQNFGTTMIQRPANISGVVSPLNLFYSNHGISCLDIVQPLLMQPQVFNHHVNYGDQTFSGNPNMEILQACNNQTMLSQQDLPQKIPIQSGTYPTHQKGSISPLGLNNNSLVHPTCLMNALPKDSTANAGISASNVLWKNHHGNSSNIESDTTPVDVDEWLDLSGYDSN